MSFPADALTQDKFLGGKLEILQPAHGYRAGVDPVLLAASVPARTGQKVLELGCGAGVASLCLGVRVPGLALAGVELQPDYADLARRNAAENAQAFDVHTTDLRDMPATLNAQGFDHVIANPPYYRRDHGSSAPDAGRDTALAGDTPLADWMNVAAKRLAPRGYLSLIQDIGRLPELLAILPATLGSLEMLPLSAREGRAPHLLLLRARKGGKAAFRLHFPLVMHVGARHQKDEESYTPLISQVLRHGADLPFPKS